MPQHIVDKFPHKIRTIARDNSIFSLRHPIANLLKLIKITIFLFRNNLWNVPVCGQDHLPDSRFFISLLNKDFEEYEDGLGNYIEPNKTTSRKLLRKLFLCDTKAYFGWSENVKKIYLTNPTCPLSEPLRKKTVFVNLQEQWNSLPYESKKFILDLYRVSIDPSENVNTIIVTRPYSEEGLMSEQKKIELLRQELNKMTTANFIIKPHYRETTNYEKYFPKCRVVKEKYPLELLLLVIGDNLESIICFGDCSIELYVKQFMKHVKYIKIEVPEEAIWFEKTIKA